MALSKDRSGVLHGQVFCQKDFPLPAGGKVFMGGMYSFDSGGRLIPAADEAVQAEKAVVFALEATDNTSGHDDARKARCLVKGLVVLPAGSLTSADVGKSVHAVGDDTLALASTNGRTVGTLLAVVDGLAEVIL